MKTQILAVLLVAGATVAQAEQPAVVKSPAEAIALADKASRNGVTGRYEMLVASTGKNMKATFLNSTDDYKSDGNLTFSIAPIVAKMLTKRYGAPPEVFLKGKRIVVDGVVKRQTIVNVENGAPRSINRFGHNVEIRQMSQIASIE